MRYVEVRRHSHRARPEQHLTQWGVTLARWVGAALGPFDRVITSPLPRCVETAVAMGFAVDQTVAALAGPDGRGESFPQADEVDWAAGHAGLAALIRAGGPLAAFAAAQAAIWRDLVQAVPEGGRLLLVGHGGGFLGGAAITLLPTADHDRWGPEAGYCEGVRVTFAGAEVAAVTILRVDPARLGLPANP